MTIHSCRFCSKLITSFDDGVKYGARHHAHFACYLDAGKKLSDLPAWMVGMFPWKVLEERGLMDEASQITDAYDAKLMSGEAA